MLKQINNYFETLKSCIDQIDRKEVDTFIKLLIQAKEEGRTIFIMGNGGSASTATHFSCDFNKGCSYNQEKKFKVICLNDNTATMLAYANDVNYESIFAEQLKNFLKEGDIVIGLSGSGNSKNVLNAIEYANSRKAITIGLTGYNGGKLKTLAAYSVNTHINDMQISEDIHMTLCHMAYSILTNGFAANNNSKELISL